MLLLLIEQHLELGRLVVGLLELLLLLLERQGVARAGLGGAAGRVAVDLERRG